MAQRDENGLTYEERLLRDIVKALDRKEKAEVGSEAEAKAKAEAEDLVKKYFELHEIFTEFNMTVGGFGVNVKKGNGDYVITFTAKVVVSEYKLPL